MIDTKELRSMVNATHFESFANSVINSLLDRLEAAEKERDWNAERLEEAIEELKALRAKVEAMEEVAIWKKRALEAEDLNRK